MRTTAKSNTAALAQVSRKRRQATQSAPPPAPAPRVSPPLCRLATLISGAAAMLLVSQRFAHLGEIIDEPHSWRQCDTANYIWAFYEGGIHFLRPSVCWLGNYRTLILEFPLSEAVSAVAYSLFGPQILWARLTTLVFFLGATYYLFAIVKHLCGSRLAALTALVYLTLPLGLYYSRAVHIDFCAVFFAHLMTYCFLRGYDERRRGLLAAGAVSGILVFLIKVPYAFYLFIPLFYHAATRPDRGLRKATLVAAALPFVAFALWQPYVDSVNARAPDWSFIPGYTKFVHMEWWYLGSLSERLQLGPWKLLAERLVFDVASPVGCVAFVAGLLSGRKSRRGVAFFDCWLAGCLVYLLIFFNLNFQHNYYQIPFLAVVAFFVARGFDVLLARLAAVSHKLAWSVVILAFAALVANSLWLAETRYYGIDKLRVVAAEVIRKNTPSGSLVITSTPATDPRDPRLLYLARRNGWSINLGDVTPSLIEALRREGAQYLALVFRGQLPQPLAWTSNEHGARTFVLLPAFGWQLRLVNIDAGGR